MKNTIYLIKSNDNIYIKDSLAKILLDNNLNEDRLIRYDLDETNVAKAIEDLDTYSFLEEAKVILVSNAPFLQAKAKSVVEHDEEAFARYLESPSPDNILILVQKNFSAALKLSKALLAVAKVYEQNIDFEALVKSRLGNLTMDRISTNYFINFCNKDSQKIVNEINKLIAYFDEGEISSQDIDEICYSSYEDNVFRFLDELSLGHKEKALNLYENLVDNYDDYMMVFALTNDHFNLLLNVKSLDSDGYKTNMIMKELGQKSQYRIEKMLSYKNLYSQKQLLKILNNLCDIDIAHKTNKEANALFESFIIEL